MFVFGVAHGVNQLSGNEYIIMYSFIFYEDRLFMIHKEATLDFNLLA